MIWMRLHQGLGRVQAEVHVASRSKVSNENDRSVETEVEQLRWEGFLDAEENRIKKLFRCQHNRWTLNLMDEQNLGYVATSHLPVTEVVVIMTSARSPRALATNRCKVMDRRDPWNEGTAPARKCKSKGCGFESQCWQTISSCEISVKVNLWNHLVEEFAHYTKVWNV